MSPLVLAAVLVAAGLHGTWNAIAKAIPDRLVSSALIGVAYLVIGGIGCLVLPPPAPASWLALGVSVVLQTAYLILLTAAYAATEFGTAYPLTRGIAVLGVTIASVTLLGERLAPVQLAGIGVVGGSLFALALARAGTLTRAGLGLATSVGAIVAAYSIVDGLGVRESGSPLGYAAWLFLLQGVTIPLAALLLSRDRASFAVGLRRHAPLGLTGGVLSLVAYAIVVWAQSIAPLALVSALRETGVVAAGLIGLLVFRERLSRVGMVATVAAAAGIIAIRAGA